MIRRSIEGAKDSTYHEAASALCQHCREGVELTYRPADKHGLNEGWHHRWYLKAEEHPSAHAGEWNDPCPADAIHRLKRVWIVEIKE